MIFDRVALRHRIDIRHLAKLRGGITDSPENRSVVWGRHCGVRGRPASEIEPARRAMRRPSRRPGNANASACASTSSSRATASWYESRLRPAVKSASAQYGRKRGAAGAARSISHHVAGEMSARPRKRFPPEPDGGSRAKKRRSADGSTRRPAIHCGDHLLDLRGEQQRPTVVDRPVKRLDAEAVA